MCFKYFSIDYGSKRIADKELLIRHLEGSSIRKLARQTDQSKSVVHRRLLQSMKRVPNSNHITELLCNKFSGYLQVDGKYLPVKGHERKMCFIWAIDYYTHDVLYHMLVPEETVYAYWVMFKFLKRCNYQLQCLICDEHQSILKSVEMVYPRAKVQICLTHYKRNIQKLLDLRYSSRDRRFFQSIKLLFASKSDKQFFSRGKQMLRSYSKNSVYLRILAEISQKTNILTTYLHCQACPATTNLIECYNKHLNGRLRTIDGFKSYDTASLWLNAYVMNRRLKKFECCKEKFKKLNGTASISLSVKDDAPSIYFLREVGS